MVAMAIIGVLAVILSAAVSSSQSAANAARCLSNLRATGAALNIYMGESGNRALSLYSGGHAFSTWPKILFDRGYASRKDVFRCPVGRTSYALDSKTWDWQTYGLNMMRPPGRTYAEGKDTIFELRPLSVPEQSTYILLADSTDIPSAKSYQTFRLNSAQTRSGVSLRHSKRANVFFLDGHSETLSRTQLEELVDAYPSQWGSFFIYDDAGGK